MPAKILAPLSILVLVFSSSAIMAEQPADKGNVKKSDTLNFVLMDCGNLDCGRNPIQVGDVVSIANNADNRKVLSVVKFLNSQGVEQSVGINVQADQIPYQSDGGTGGSCTDCVWFESADCDETNENEPGYLNIDPTKSFSPTFKPFAIVGVNSQPDIRELWISASDVVQEITAQSYKENTTQGCTGPIASPPAPFLVIPAELVDPNLHDTFKPPYTLGLK